jgi:GDPmannose 4,6-dehydratase
MIKKRALICGISGQDGGYLAKLLIQKDYEVFGTSRNSQGKNFENLISLNIFDKISILSVSVENYQSVHSAILNTNPDEIYYLTGQSSVELSFAQPIDAFQSITLGVINFLDAIISIKKPIKFYNAGSSECYGNSTTACIDENSCFNPRSPYGIAKSSSHQLVKNYVESYSIFACTGILSNHESGLRPNRYVTQKIIQSAKRIKAGKQNKLELGNINISRDWGWAPEYVEAMWLMLQQDDPEDYVIGTGKTYKLEDFISEAFNLLNLDWRECVIANDNFRRPTDIVYSCTNPKKAKEKLGWEAKIYMPDVVRKMIEF